MTPVRPKTDHEPSSALRSPLQPVQDVQSRENVTISPVDADLSALMKDKLQISGKTANNKTHPPSDALATDATKNPLTNENETIDWEKERKDMDKLFDQQAETQLTDLPAFEKPKQFRKSLKLYDHQQDAVRWLIEQERNPRPNPFSHGRQLKDGSIVYYDRFTRGRLEQPHEPAQGSILADEMGLGKTVATLALILSHPPHGHVYGSDEGMSAGPVCTLIICPKTVISNWSEQIENFVKPGIFRVETYTGDRKRRSKIIQKCEDGEVDILLSSYETVSSEFASEMKDKTGNAMLGIHDASFWRVVLDEAQQIRNPKSKCFQAISGVANSARHRLALTGTPFVNNPDDIASLLSFIGLEPLSDFKNFKFYITDPIKDRKRAGLTRLRAALSYASLRRTKNVVNLDMAKKTIQVCHVDFPDGIHKDIHDSLYLAAQIAFDGSINGKDRRFTEINEDSGVGAVAQQAMFEMLLRVRQSCASGSLVPEDRVLRAQKVMNHLKLEDGSMKKLTAAEGNRVIDFLKGGLDLDDSFGNTQISSAGGKVTEPSPKICFLLKIIEEMSSDEKGVIFSQWTSMLDVIERALLQAGHKCVRIDGSMTSDERTRSMQKLNHDDDVRFILCSLKAAGVGINLTRANVVVMMDPWWNDAVEMQAIDRVHRMGQRRDVRVHRLVMKGTIEERMLNIQKAKAALGKGAMTKLTRDEEKAAKMTALKDLFQIEEGDADQDDWLY